MRESSSSFLLLLVTTLIFSLSLLDTTTSFVCCSNNHRRADPKSLSTTSRSISTSLYNNINYHDHHAIESSSVTDATNENATSNDYSSSVFSSIYNENVIASQQQQQHPNATTIITTPRAFASRRDMIRSSTAAAGALLVVMGGTTDQEHSFSRLMISSASAATTTTTTTTPSKPLLNTTSLTNRLTSAPTTTTTAPSTPQSTSPLSSSPSSPSGGTLAPVNLTKVAEETSINVTIDSEKGCVSVDARNFTKIQNSKVPGWLPPYLRPQPKIIKQITDPEILVASTLAGGTMEIIRTSLLYPIQTIKTRIQTDPLNSRQPKRRKRKSGSTVIVPLIRDKLGNLKSNVRRHYQEGKLYTGIKPTLLVSVPATGVYFGVRDVSKRMLLNSPHLDDVAVVLTAALIADIVSLSFRAPADALTLRLQALSQFDKKKNKKWWLWWKSSQTTTITTKGNDKDEKEDEYTEEEVGDWFGDSLRRLPQLIATDLPYLLSKIFLSRQFLHGSVSIDRYAEVAIGSAVVAAFLTTPFDVARTRILVDSDGDASNGLDGGSGAGVIATLVQVSKEDENGIQNLFAGWLERVLYLGFGRAWLEPLQLIGFVAIRDTLLLEWF